MLCDKPFGRNAAEAAVMHDLAPGTGVLHFLNFENRVVPHAPGGDHVLFSAVSGTNPLFAAQRQYAEVLRDAVHEHHVPSDVPTFGDGLACAVVMDSAGDPPCP